ncbi:MAG: ABC transporter ATP-binding protein [Candidatus Marinimicrobia bacterium]|nr:ABC transporter ATP-binding protein [Candidatus Neomarinimicrobiota bacterium]
MILRLDGIDFSYHGNQPVFKNLDLTIPLNCWAVLTGDCGTGKTTLAKLIAGLLKPDKGSIRFENDNDINNSLEVGYIFQNPDDQFVHFNIEREVAFNLENRGASPAIVRKAVQLALESVNLWPRRENSPHELSGGEKQKLAIADWLVSKPQVLIFDETTAFLDLPTRFELYENIRQLIVAGLSVIWISQEDYEIAFADYIIELLPGYLLRTSSNK